MSGICCGSAVKAVPCEPENEHTKGCKRHGVTWDGVDFNTAVWMGGVFANTRPEDLSTNKGCNPAAHMNGCGTSEINETEVVEPATAVPNPMRFYRIDHETNDEAVNAVSGEFGTFCHCTRNDGGCSGAEHEIKEE